MDDAAEHVKGPRARRSDQTRRVLLETALTLFSRNGYDSTSLQQVADAMGLTKAAVYHHFRTKAEILQAITEPGYLALERLIASLMAIDDPELRHARLVEGFADLLTMSRPLSPLLSHDPAVRTREPFLSRNAELREQLVHAAYGNQVERSTLFATLAAVALTDAVVASPDLTDVQLSAELRGILWRILPPPRTAE